MLRRFAFSPDSCRRATVWSELYPSGCLDGFVMVVDCLLGTGFQGVLHENYRTAIEEINASGAEVISVDINSGMNGDTGRVS